MAGLELHFAHMPHTHAAKYDTDYVLRHHNTEHSLDTPPDGPRSAELYSSITAALDLRMAPFYGHTIEARILHICTLPSHGSERLVLPGILPVITAVTVITGNYW